jgi:mono/diheme cytochrome c family protein
MSLGQGTRWLSVLTVSLVFVGASPVAAKSVLAPDSPPIPKEEAAALKSPIAFSKKSIAKGRGLYLSYNCAQCHGFDGKAQTDAMGNATDLTAPDYWKNGVTEGEIFRSIRDGSGLAMRPFKGEIKDEDEIWHIVNYIRNFWVEGKRPPLQADPQ